MEYPKLPILWKQQFLKALRGGCYRFIRGDWYRRLRIEEVEQGLEQGQIHEYGYCTLGAAYHFSTGENQASNGYLDAKVPEAFRNQDVRNRIMSLNDTYGNRSFKKTADWIEENL